MHVHVHMHVSHWETSISWPKCTNEEVLLPNHPFLALEREGRLFLVIPIIPITIPPPRYFIEGSFHYSISFEPAHLNFLLFILARFLHTLHTLSPLLRSRTALVTPLFSQIDSHRGDKTLEQTA